MKTNYMAEVLYIVIPCYNEAEVLPITAPLFLGKLSELIEKNMVSGDSRILFVDDGSSDRTWEIIKSLNKEDSRYIGLQQSKNRGHQNAVWGGMMEARKLADIVISIDCDGQDDINAMNQMLEAYYDGCDIVYGVRSSRKKDTVFKRSTAQLYYKLLNAMGAEVVYNHADYRLLSKRVLNELSQFREVNLFLRGMIPLVGYKSTSVLYERDERIAGKTHYPLKKMLYLAMDGITSLSVKPLHIISALGCIVSILSFFGILWAVIGHMMGYTVAGWASMICVVCFFSGIQLICLGVLGEYIGKIYMEVKNRPRYIISDAVGLCTDSDSAAENTISR